MVSSERYRVCCISNLRDPAADIFLVLADESKTCMRLLGVEKVDGLGLQNVGGFQFPCTGSLK